MTRSATAAEPRQRFPRSQRVRKRPEFLALQHRAHRRVTANFVVLVQRRDAPPSRLGVTTSRKIGHAPDRNRVRRLVREFFRRHHHELQPAVDVVVIARTGAPELHFRDVERQLAAALCRNG